MFVGNDVVDLRAPRIDGKAADERFVRRILDAHELAAVKAAAEPDLELWSTWAAKEAGFKVMTKLRGEPPPFVHASFGVRWEAEPAAPDESPRPGVVAYGPEELTVAVELYRPGEGVLHAVAHADGAELAGVARGLERLDRPAAPWAGDFEELLARLSDRERPPVHSRASAAVRIAAKLEASRALSVEPSRLEIVCAPGAPGRRPPELHVDGMRSPADVSLSHHGAWIGWVVWTEARGVARLAGTLNSAART